LLPIYVGLWVRIALLRVLHPKYSPAPSQMITADGVLMFVEGILTIGLVVIAASIAGISWWWVIGLIVIVLVIGQVIRLIKAKFSEKRFVQVFKILDQPGARLYLGFLLAVAILTQPVRFYLAMNAVGLDASWIQSGLAFLGTSIINALPVGQGPASVGGMAAFLGPSNIDLVAAAGILLLATTMLACLIYSLVSGLIYLRSRSHWQKSLLIDFDKSPEEQPHYREPSSERQD
jgi:hypothetical protein